MGIRDHVNPEILAYARQFTSWIEDGTIRKQVLPNTSCEFDEEKVLENADALSKSRLLDNLISDTYGRGK